MAKDTGTLNARQERFCLEYAKTGNASEAYRRAGYTARTEATINSGASTLARNPKVQARLAELAAEIHNDRIADVKEIQEHLTSIIRGDDLDERLGVDAMGESVRLKVKTQANQVKAAELLARMQGAYDGSVQVNVTVPVIGGEAMLRD